MKLRLSRKSRRWFALLAGIATPLVVGFFYIRCVFLPPELSFLKAHPVIVSGIHMESMGDEMKPAEYMVYNWRQPLDAAKWELGAQLRECGYDPILTKPSSFGQPAPIKQDGTSWHRGGVEVYLWAGRVELHGAEIRKAKFVSDQGWTCLSMHRCAGSSWVTILRVWLFDPEDRS